MIAAWQAPCSEGRTSEELLIAFDESREQRVLILPAWFDEANKMRRLTVQMMRVLDQAGIDSFLPDLPGCNESLVPLKEQSVSAWRACALAAVDHVGASHVLAIRAGALLAPPNLPGWLYAPQTGPKVLRGMIRARAIAAREAGREESAEELQELGRSEGLTLAGWSIGPQMFRELETAEPITGDMHATVEQKKIGGAGLWLRAEPGDNEEQAQALAKIVAGEGAIQQ